MNVGDLQLSILLIWVEDTFAGKVNAVSLLVFQMLRPLKGFCVHLTDFFAFNHGKEGSVYILL